MKAISYIKTVPDWRTDNILNKTNCSREKSKRFGDNVISPQMSPTAVYVGHPPASKMLD